MHNAGVAADFDLVLRGGLVWADGRLDPGDVAVRGGKIVAVGRAEGQAAETADIGGLAVLPGAIDSQVHFREPGLTHKEDFESGTRAAVAGGVTSVFDEPNTDPTTTTEAAFRAKLALAEGRAWCHYGLWVGASTENLDDLARLEALPHTPGVGEVFMASSTGPLLVPDDASLRRVLQNGRHRVSVHAEDEETILANRRALSPGSVHQHPEVRSVESSLLATRRIIALSAETARPVHVLHVSTADELPLLEAAKREGLGTTCEATPQHLWFSSEDYGRLGTRLQMNTPVREPGHREALRNAVAAGLFDVFGSDHAPHTLEEKAAPYPDSPSGMPGVQTLVPAVLTMAARGVFPLGQAVAMLAENPARLFRLPGKGRIASGFDADLMVVDLDAEYLVEAGWLQSKCGWSPFEGERFRGRVVHTLVGGRFAVRDGALALPGLGRPLDFAPG